MEAFIKVFCITIASFLIGSEYSSALGWGVWLLAVSID